MTKPLKQQLVEEIRKAEKSGITRYRLSKESGVAQSQLRRILQGQHVYTETAEKLFKALGKKISIS